MDSATFYNNFIDYQVKSGINDRIYSLYQKLCHHGFSSTTSVLEIGCGIGTLTYLLQKKITQGKIEAVDISPKSVAFAQQHIKTANVSFTAADILQYKPQVKQFDRILLFDVLEHIPLSQHQQVFQRISEWMHSDSLLLINIPNPAAILHEQKHNPAALQETDQPVYIGPLAAAMEAAAVDILSVEMYDVWQKEEYQFIVARKRKDYDAAMFSNKRNTFQKGVVWLKRKWRRVRYPYPPRK